MILQVDGSSRRTDCNLDEGGQNQTKAWQMLYTWLTGAPGQDNSNLLGFIVCLTCIVFMQLYVLCTPAVSVTVASPHSAPWVLSPVVSTRCSGCVQRALDDWWCSHTYTGASASRSHTPDLENTQTQTHTEVSGNYISLKTSAGTVAMTGFL